MPSYECNIEIGDRVQFKFTEVHAPCMGTVIAVRFTRDEVSYDIIDDYDEVHQYIKSSSVDNDWK